MVFGQKTAVLLGARMTVEMKPLAARAYWRTSAPDNNERSGVVRQSDIGISGVPTF